MRETALAAQTDPRARRTVFAGNAALAAMSTAVLLAAGELAVRLSGMPAGDVGLLHDQAVLKSGWWGPLPRWMAPDPELMWRYRPSQDVIERPKYLPPFAYRTNAQGFRGEEIPDPPARPLVLCMGGSVTAGYGVRDADAYPSVLQELLRADPATRSCQVINGGVFGYTSEQGRIYLAKLLPRLRPDVVVIQFGVNDDWRTPFPDASLIGGGGILRLKGALSRAGLYRLLRVYIVRLKIAHAASRPMSARVPPERYRENLQAMVVAVRRQGGVPILAAPTSLWELGVKPHLAARKPDRVFDHLPMAVYRHAMAGVAHDQVVAYLELPVLTGQLPESRERFLDWCHPDPEGLCMIARELRRLVGDALRHRAPG